MSKLPQRREDKEGAFYDFSFVNLLHEGVVVFNHEGEIIYSNKAGTAILGLSTEEMHDRTMQDARWQTIHEDGTVFEQRDHPSVVTLRTGVGCRNVVMGVVKPSSEISWININSKALFKEGTGELYQVVCTFTDITEQKRSEAELRSAERIQRLILSSTRSAFLLLNRDFRIIMHNDSAKEFCQMINGNPHIDSRHYLDLVPQEYRRFVNTVLNWSVNGREAEYTWPIPALGKDRYFRVIFRPVWDEEHRVIGVYNIVKDITREKNDAEALLVTRMRFQAIFNSTYQFMAILDPAGKVVDVNDTFVDLSGIKKKKLIGKYFWNAAIWDVSEVGGTSLKEKVKDACGGAIVRYETEIRDKKATPVLVDLSIKPVYGAQNDCLYLIVEGRTIDEQRKMERELVKMEMQLSSFMANTPASSWIVDEDHVLRYLNPPALLSYGLSESAIGRFVGDLFPEEISVQYIENNEVVFDTDRPLETTETAEGCAGNIVIQHVIKFPLGIDGTGKRLLGGVAMDITQAENARKELLALNQRYEYVLKATSDAVWDWDIKSDRIYLGEASSRLFGCKDLVVAMSTRVARIHPKDRSRYEESIAMALRGGSEHWELEYEFKRLDGYYRVIFDRAYIIRDDKNEAVRMIGAMQDVTDHRKLEERMLNEVVNRKREIVKAIIKAQEEERKEIADELHDNVGQLLATCRLYLDMCLKKDADNSLLKEGFEMLNTLIGEIRGISHRLTPAAFQEKMLCDAVGELVSRLNDVSNLTINFQVPEDHKIEKLLSAGTKTAIYRIIQEQMNNILKHAQASVVDIYCVEHKGSLSLRVSDNGIGFEVNKVKRGLGLNNILSRVSLLGGKVVFDSSPGNGCTMKVDIPVNDEVVPEKADF